MAALDGRPSSRSGELDGIGGSAIQVPDRAPLRRTPVRCVTLSARTGGGANQYGGGFGGSTMAAGAVNFRFRCGQ
jgi:hypothetical protein